MMAHTGHALLWRQLRLPRQGHSLEECQDAAAGEPDSGRFAVADGASESPHAALWARLLVEAFVRGTQAGLGWSDWLAPVQQRWSDAVTPHPGQAPLPWYLEPGVAQGAFATFVGLVVKPGNPGQPWMWDSLAIGDSCLFQTRGDKLVLAFPVARSTDFDNTPWLVGSRHAPRRRGEVRQGDAQPQDRFWLMTDALAQWFLAQAEANAKPWRTAERLLRDPAAEQLFADWIADLRRSRQLRNDDVTLLGVGLE